MIPWGWPDKYRQMVHNVFGDKEPIKTHIRYKKKMWDDLSAEIETDIYSDGIKFGIDNYGVVLWHRALIADEIIQHYNHGIPIGININGMEFVALP